MPSGAKSLRKIAVVTGSRAEYGLLFLLLKEIAIDPDLELQLIATGMHLSPEFGLTYREIEKDNFTINTKLEMLLSSDTAASVAKSVGVGILGFADAFQQLGPDVLVILGDRFEILAAAQTAFIMKIPIAHIHGGELTQAAIDDGIRHAITKISHLHFTAAEPYRHRVIQMGEDPRFVFNTGALGVERIKKMVLLDKPTLEKKLDFRFGELTFLVTYHPVTLAIDKITTDLQNLFSALDFFTHAKIIITKANADESGRLVNRWIDDYVSKNLERVKAFTSMGDLNYLSTLKWVDVVIGNSSSGIIEAPSLHVPTVNIGDRQKGRLRASSIIDCQTEKSAIQSSIQKALSNEFKTIAKKTVSPYDQGNTAWLIKERLKTIDLSQLTRKKFYDIGILEYA